MKKTASSPSARKKSADSSILVVGSVALDSVKTPFGEVKDALGGSATYFGVSASYFAPVKLVAVVGKDFPSKHVKLLKSRGIDTSGLLRAPGKTFRWKGYYEYDLNNARTLDTKLNVFADFKPELDDAARDSRYVFLGNIDPEIQTGVLKKIKKPRLVGADTMNFWIERKPEALKEMIRFVDVLIINEGETREFAKEKNLVRAARRIMSWGPRWLVVKRGEYGALLFSQSEVFAAPAYPLENISDPTGAGDSFAGGFMGALASSGMSALSGKIFPSMASAVVSGSVMASFNVESFSLGRLANLDGKKIAARFGEFIRLTRFA
ncbi:MAG: sugar kinase [Elusimicrobia bacterium HGW-Elusimicrobia-1]|jgi:sugar/nucleoside kinase (ribokinase family)|nr:MAG: sugar kinase [Elusimicrobia bacterium HGW-Elusimicrobia-1]